VGVSSGWRGAVPTTCRPAAAALRRRLPHLRNLARQRRRSAVRNPSHSGPANQTCLAVPVAAWYNAPEQRRSCKQSMSIPLVEQVAPVLLALRPKGEDFQQERSGDRSRTKMISWCVFSRKCRFSARAHCDEKGCCKRINVSADCVFRYSQTVDFWDVDPNGPHGAFGIGERVGDRLAGACWPEGRGLDVTGRSYRRLSFSIPCQ